MSMSASDVRASAKEILRTAKTRDEAKRSLSGLLSRWSGWQHTDFSIFFYESGLRMLLFGIFRGFDADQHSFTIMLSPETSSAD